MNLLKMRRSRERQKKIGLQKNYLNIRSLHHRLELFGTSSSITRLVPRFLAMFMTLEWAYSLMTMCSYNCITFIPVSSFDHWREYWTDSNELLLKRERISRSKPTLICDAWSMFQNSRLAKQTQNNFCFHQVPLNLCIVHVPLARLDEARDVGHPLRIESNVFHNLSQHGTIFC